MSFYNMKYFTGFAKMEKTLLLLNGTPLQYSCLVHPMDGGAW